MTCGNRKFSFTALWRFDSQSKQMHLQGYLDEIWMYYFAHLIYSRDATKRFKTVVHRPKNNLDLLQFLYRTGSVSNFLGSVRIVRIVWDRKYSGSVMYLNQFKLFKLRFTSTWTSYRTRVIQKKRIQTAESELSCLVRHEFNWITENPWEQRWSRENYERVLEKMEKQLKLVEFHEFNNKAR